MQFINHRSDFNHTHTWWPHFLLASLALLSLAAMASPTLTLHWQYDRTAIGDGRWWRMLTGHLVHWNFDHWLWDWTTFVALGLVGLRQMPKRTGLTVLGAAVAISCSTWTWLPELQWYRGLSGLDTALFTLLATDMLTRSIRAKQYSTAWLVLLCVAGLLAKTGFELFTDSTLFVDSTAAGFETVTMAHAVGALVGFGVALPFTQSGLEEGPAVRPGRALRCRRRSDNGLPYGRR